MAAAAMKILVTGPNGLIGSEAVGHFAGQGHIVHGIDNNMRAKEPPVRRARAGTRRRSRR